MIDLNSTRLPLGGDPQKAAYYSLPAYARLTGVDLSRLPYSIRTLMEMVLRQAGEEEGTAGDLEALAGWKCSSPSTQTISILPQRVVMQDLTGVPVLNDLASLREAVTRAGGDPDRVNPLIPVDLVVDHSIQADFTGIPEAYQKNLELEFKRNRERYQFLHWAQGAFRNFRLIPPGNGIVHQVNLESLSPVVRVSDSKKGPLAVPDMVIGTDSHTPMINGLGVLGWGVGGIEAIAAMLGNPLELPIPEVVGVRLSGKLPPGSTPTDLTLFIVQALRRMGVVDKFIEFSGPALGSLGVPERAMIANMAPEYGATAGYFPVDGQTIAYLRLTGRDAATVTLVEQYFRAQGLFRDAASPEPEFSRLLAIDLGMITPAISGPKKPESRVSLSEVKRTFRELLKQPVAEGGYGIVTEDLDKRVEVGAPGGKGAIKHGTVVLAAITSCTNTSNPYVMMAAGLLARNAVARGLKANPVVKASLSPGSRVVTDYLARAGLLEPLEDLGFSLAGYGCMTCIGNSGPLNAEIENAIQDHHLVTAGVLSGNRNFEGRVQPLVRANYLASPPLVVAFALAGRVDIDLTSEPLAFDPQGSPVTLADLWPAEDEIRDVIDKHVTREAFQRNDTLKNPGSREWQDTRAGGEQEFAWDSGSTYLRNPPFVQLPNVDWNRGVDGARALAVFGDGVTTDHISPAGAIKTGSPAGRYLVENGVSPAEFNSYGSRRGNHEVMARGTFANIRLKNRLADGVEGGKTTHLPSGELMDIYDAAMRYREEHTPLIILAGREYGTGSSRDWAAKGVLLLGVRAVVAESFERIHRSNLAGMGILPLQFMEGESMESLGLTGREKYSLPSIAELQPGGLEEVRVEKPTGEVIRFRAKVLIRTQQEMETFLLGGLLKKAFSDLRN